MACQGVITQKIKYFTTILCLMMHLVKSALEEEMINSMFILMILKTQF